MRLSRAAASSAANVDVDEYLGWEYWAKVAQDNFAGIDVTKLYHLLSAPPPIDIDSDSDEEHAPKFSVTVDQLKADLALALEANKKLQEKWSSEEDAQKKPSLCTSRPPG